MNMAFSRLKSIRLSGPLVAGSFLLLGFLLFGSVAPVEAANSCNFTRSGNFTLTATECSITSGTIDGIDAGNLIIGPNKTIRIETGAKLVINPGSEINLDTGSQLIIDKPSSATGAIVKGNICVKDADTDGYVDYNSTVLHPTAGRQPVYTFTNSSCTTPNVRKSSAAATFLTEFDCFDTVNGKRQHNAGFPSAPAGDGLIWSGATVVNNVGTCGQYVTGKQRRLLRWTVTNTSIANCGIADRSIWEDYDDSLVCCTTGYRDYDKDGYGAGVQGCYNPDAAYNVVANNDDCDDGNNAIIVGSTRSITSCYTDSACGTAGTETCQSGGGGNWATTTACIQSAAACCKNGALRPSTYVCSAGTLDNPASGSCRRQTTDYRCTGTTATCGTTNPVTRYEYASTNGYTWNQSTQTWVSANCSIYASAGAANSCSGQQPQRPVYGCTAGANSSYTVSAAATCSYGSACGGGENSRCVSGSCSNLCSNSIDDDGDTFKDLQDIECGGCQQCLSGACCNSANACYTSGSTCRASAGVCDIAESCSGSSASCPVDSFRANSYKCFDGSPTGASGACRTTDTDQYCSGVAAACNGSTVPIYGYADANHQVWNGAGTWVYANYNGSAGVYANLTGPACNGQTPRYSIFGCTAGANSVYSSPYAYYNLSACSGAENNRCTSGSCQELCSDGIDNDGNGLTDSADPACPTNQCTSGACCDTSTGQFRNSSYVCRASGGTCDIQETCTGASASCPADSVRANSYKCYDGTMAGSSGSCRTSDTDQYCSGSGYLCNGSTSTTYGYASINGQVWNGGSWIYANYNGSTGVYSQLTGPTCYNGSPRYAVYGCTAGANTTYLYTYYNSATCSGGENSICVDGSATCVNKCVAPYYPTDNDGDGYTDPQDSNCGGCGQCTSGACCNTATGCFISSGTTCRASAGSCDIAETCSGSSASCPADSFQPSSYACRTPSGACDAIEMCTGTGASCPVDAKLAAGTVCRAAGTLPCNPAETCDGINNTCPAETNTDGTLCAYSRGVCENDRYCSSGTCPSVPSYLSTTYYCSIGSFSGSPGSCITSATDQKCSGGSYLCNGTISTRFEYADVNGKVWNGSSWVYASYPGTYSLLTGPNYCSGQQRQYSVYGCTAGNSSNYLYTYSSYGLSACSGTENNMCQDGTCVNKCVAPYYPADNDGDGYTDPQDSNCGGCGQCASGACCNTITGCYQPSTYVCNYTTWGAWTGVNGACQVSRSRGLNKCLGTSSSCPTGINGGETEYSYIASGYVWWNSASIYTTSTAYCGLDAPSSSCYCSGQQPMCMVKACNGSGSCSVYDDTHFAASGSPCNGTTSTCSNGVCVACTTGYRDYDKDGYGTGSSSCWTASSSYNVVANNTDCNDSANYLWRTVSNLAADADRDGYTASTSGGSYCVGASTGGLAPNYGGTYYNDSPSLTYRLLSGPSGTADCYDTSATVFPGNTGTSFISCTYAAACSGYYGDNLNNGDHDCSGWTYKAGWSNSSVYFSNGWIGQYTTLWLSASGNCYQYIIGGLTCGSTLTAGSWFSSNIPTNGTNTCDGGMIFYGAGKVYCQ